MQWHKAVPTPSIDPNIGCAIRALASVTGRAVAEVAADVAAMDPDYRDGVQGRTITVCAHRYGLREVRVKPGMWTLEDMARLVGYGIVMVTDGRGRLRLRDYCHVVAIRRGRVIDTQDLTRVARVATLV